MASLAARNLKVFFRDRAAVIMSMFAVFVVIGLYALFLGDQLASDFSQLGDGAGEKIVNSWVIAGIIAVTSMTSTLGALGIMVDDKASGAERDFISAPLQRASIAGAYALSSYLVGCILTLITFVLGEIYIVATGGELLSASATIQMILGILLSVASSGAIVFFIVSFLKTPGAFSSVSLVIGVSIGFITGCYIPIGAISEGVAMAVKTFPVSYSSSFFRLLMTEEPMKVAFENAPDGLLQEYQQDLGIYYTFGDDKTTMTTAIVVMVITAIVFFSLACIRFAVKKKN